jgi:epoxyqueuosine reductase
MKALETRIKDYAADLGFELVGIAPASPADGFDRLQTWLDQGFAGEMDYMKRHSEARRHPAAVLPNVRSVIMVGMNYFDGPGDTNDSIAVPGRGRVARYARGPDYHDLLRTRLQELLQHIQEIVPAAQGRPVADTAPLLERDFARRAGLGWLGKNTMLINTRLGSYFFLGALLLNIELRTDPPHVSSHCGSCTACLDACPTQAFAAPGQLDSRRCISYLTIELKRPIPEPFRHALDGWVFGCDICQEVCPWNRKAPETSEPALRLASDLRSLDLVELLLMSEADFRRRFRRTALMRAKRRGLLRNAAIILGSRRDRSALSALAHAAADQDPIICEAASWAIAQIQSVSPTDAPPQVFPILQRFQD